MLIGAWGSMAYRDAHPSRYRRGQGIAPHQDGPLYHPVVAILSLAGPAMLQFWPSLRATKDGCPDASVMCLPNSLLVFSEDAYLVSVSAAWRSCRKEAGRVPCPVSRVATRSRASPWADVHRPAYGSVPHLRHPPLAHRGANTIGILGKETVELVGPS